MNPGFCRRERKAPLGLRIQACREWFRDAACYSTEMEKRGHLLWPLPE
jgi:hypothetical protein